MTLHKASMRAHSAVILLCTTILNACGGDAGTSGSPGTLQLVQTTFDASEGSVVDIQVSRSGGNAGVASVDYATTDRTAVGGVDYPVTSGTATWVDGISGNQTISIAITDDILVELSESFIVSLNTVSVASLGENTTAIVTIIDNDTPPPIDIIRPVISLLGDNPQLIPAGMAYTEWGATATDDVDGNISGSIMIDASAVDTATAGTYTVTYEVSDAAGNAALTVTRTVIVEGTPMPSPNSAAAFGWRQYAETDLQLSEFHGQNFTIVARILLQYPQAYTGSILAAVGGGFEVSKQDEASQLRARFGESTFSYSLAPLQDATWHHIAIVRQDNFLHLYVDGREICPDGVVDCRAPAGVASGLLRVGRAGSHRISDASEDQFYGFIDDVAVFTRNLPQSEIEGLVARPRLDGSESSLYAGWTFDESTPDGNVLPAVLSRAVTYYRVTPAGDTPSTHPFKTTVSHGRDSASDTSALPPPNNQIPLTLPFLPGEAWLVTQGWLSPGSHKGRAAFAIDFSLAGQPVTASVGKPFYAAAPGPIVQLLDTRTSCSGHPANHIDIEHASEEYGVYLHHVQNSAAVSLGQIVPRGAYLADVGDTGNTACNAFHLHFALHNLPESEAGYLVTIPGAFENYEVSTDGGQTWNPVDSGVPESGQWVRNP